MYYYKKRKRYNLIKQHAKRLAMIALATLGAYYLANAGIDKLSTLEWHNKHIIIIERANAEHPQEDASSVDAFLTYQAKKQAKQLKGEFSAYNAEVGQTDADPFTMASGKRVYQGAIANNCLAFGTKIKIGSAVYIVEDRMASRYGCNVFDIFLDSHSEAVAFGRQSLNYEVIE